MKNYLLIVSGLLITFSLFAQSPDEKQKAVLLCKEGIDEMDKGEIEKALVLFEQAKKLDPENIHYAYEIAHSHFLTRNYGEAISILEPLREKDEATEHVYNLLGSSYEFNKDETKALEIYNAGLAKFPSSGIIYNSLGNYFIKNQNYNEALNYFEKGIKAQPSFSSNYYWASKLHSSMEDKLWGIIFAEIYINMEGVNDQSKELSRMIFDVYENGIKTSGNELLIDIADADTLGKNFEHEVEVQLHASAKKVNKPISSSSLYEIRSNFIQNWVVNGKHDRYPNLLFDWHKVLLLKGYMEPYHYWLFKESNPGEFEKYTSKNEVLYNEFMEWLSINYLKPNTSEYFISSQYQ